MRLDIKLLFQELHLLFGGLAAGIILLSFIGMLLVARLLIQPITKLTKATEKMGTETFDVPLAIQSPLHTIQSYLALLQKEDLRRSWVKNWIYTDKQSIQWRIHY